MKNTVVMAFGRMNPPTVGHEKLIDKVKSVAAEHGADHEIILSHSSDKKRNPLTAEQKLKHARAMFPGTNISTSSKEMPTYLHHAKRLSQSGYKHLVMVAGSDRVPEFKKTLEQYNGKPDHHNFESIKVVSAGNRDPDAEGTEGMSASKMRAHASSGDFHSFRKGLPTNLKTRHAIRLFNDVRRGLKEEKANFILRIIRETREYFRCQK